MHTHIMETEAQTSIGNEVAMMNGLQPPPSSSSSGAMDSPVLSQKVIHASASTPSSIAHSSNGGMLKSNHIQSPPPPQTSNNYSIEMSMSSVSSAFSQAPHFSPSPLPLNHLPPNLSITPSLSRSTSNTPDAIKSHAPFTFLANNVNCTNMIHAQAQGFHPQPHFHTPALNPPHSNNSSHQHFNQIHPPKGINHSPSIIRPPFLHQPASSTNMVHPILGGASVIQQTPQHSLQPSPPCPTSNGIARLHTPAPQLVRLCAPPPQSSQFNATVQAVNNCIVSQTNASVTSNVEQSPCNCSSIPSQSLKQPHQQKPNAAALSTQPITKDDGDSSDTDMEIKSLDLTGRVNLGEVSKRAGEKEERERPMSWEGELQELEEKIHLQEEQMKVELEEPMSPMSPASDHDHQDPDPDHDLEIAQVKCEESAAEELLRLHSGVGNTTIFPTTRPGTHSQTDSPLQTRSDSGCELHIGPFTPTQSPLLPRIHTHTHPHTHSQSPTHLYSPTQSPSQSRHLSGFSSPYSHSPSTGLSRNNSDASQYGGSYNSYSSAPSPISPTHYSPSQSPNLSRVGGSFGGVSVGLPSMSILGGPLDLRENPHSLLAVEKEEDRLSADLAQHSVLATQSGITRQQLINRPCPICGDKVSGFHYGIFSCESCKGFFKRTVQNKKNYGCMRGSSCAVTIATRKKCPSCRFDKCIRKGMKLEAIREDRTRGGRSTYQCAPYTLPPSLMSPASSGISLDQSRSSDVASVKSEPSELEDVKPHSAKEKMPVPELLQQIYDVEHLWHSSHSDATVSVSDDAREAMADSSDCPVNSMCKIAEGRLYKIVKWCKSLPLFRHISIDDQIILLMNSWCELLLLSCCFRSMSTPGEIRVSSGRSMSQVQAEQMGIGPCVERMLNLSFQLRRLNVDKYEYMAMKVIVLLTSDVGGLKECEKVRYSQEKVVQSLQEYTLAHYPHMPTKFGELLLRIPELQRTCHASKEMLSVKKKEGDVSSFNFLFELLRGDH